MKNLMCLLALTIVMASTSSSQMFAQKQVSTPSDQPSTIVQLFGLLELDLAVLDTTLAVPDALQVSSVTGNTCGRVHKIYWGTANRDGSVGYQFDGKFNTLRVWKIGYCRDIFEGEKNWLGLKKKPLVACYYTIELFDFTGDLIFSGSFDEVEDGIEGWAVFDYCEMEVKDCR